MKEGKYDGLRETYHENGDLKIRKNYKDDKLDGFYDEYFDGVLWFRWNYKKGLRHGLRQRFNENGEIEEEVCFLPESPVTLLDKSLCDGIK